MRDKQLTMINKNYIVGLIYYIIFRGKLLYEYTKDYYDTSYPGLIMNVSCSIYLERYRFKLTEIEILNSSI